MGLFGFGKKDHVIDLTKKVKKPIQQEAETDTGSESHVSGGFGFLGNLAGAGDSSQATETQEIPTIGTENADEKRRRLAKRLMDITTELEDISNQIYHLQQRVELLERKTGVR